MDKKKVKIKQVKQKVQDRYKKISQETIINIEQDATRKNQVNPKRNNKQTKTKDKNMDRKSSNKPKQPRKNPN